MTPPTTRRCEKVIHDDREGGYLHAADDDSPYDVDGVPYCGRCHYACHPVTLKCYGPIVGDRPATPPTTKLVAMSGIHECALQITIAKMEEAGEGDYTGGLREILSVVQSLASGETVVIERGEIDGLRELKEAIAKMLAHPVIRLLASELSGG